MTKSTAYRNKELPAHTFELSEYSIYQLALIHLKCLISRIEKLFPLEKLYYFDNWADSSPSNYSFDFDIFFLQTRKRWYWFDDNKKQSLLTINLQDMVQKNEIVCKVMDEVLLLVALDQLDLYRRDLDSKDDVVRNVTIKMMKHY